MLGVSEENIVEHVEGEGLPPHYDIEETTTLVYNQTDPFVIVDGINRITVIEAEDGQYLVDYWGYLAGYLKITREGVVELGESLLGDRRTIPVWLVDSETDITEIPWWLPDDYNPSPTVECQNCGRKAPAKDIVTPGSFGSSDGDIFCRDCWDDVSSQMDS